MTTRRRQLVPAAAMIAAAFLASGPTTPSAVAAPPTTTPSAAEGTPPTTPDNEFVESWALGPQGSLDPSQPGNRAQLSYAVDPGATIQDGVTLYNTGNVQLTFNLYATDAFDNAAGQFDLLAGDKAPSDAGSWVTIAQTSISVPPRKQATIPITIRVPIDASPGDHAGAVLASNVTQGVNDAGAVVNFDRRTGTRMYVRINGPLTPELTITKFDSSFDHSLNPFGGTSHLTYRVENHGNVRLGGAVTATVAGPFGLGSTTVKLPDVPELLPGGSITMTADVNDAPELFVGNTTLHIEPTGAGDVKGATAISASDQSFTPPLGLLLIVLLILLVLLARRIRRRRLGEQLDDERPPLRIPELQSR